MKKVFVYFDNMAMCENTAQAVDFINSLPGITCNDHTVKLLDDLFEGRKDYHGCDIRSLATTGCGKSRIRIYDALADTLEKHQEEYLRREAEKLLKIEKQRTEQMLKHSTDCRKTMEELIKPKKGIYKTELVIWYYDMDQKTKLFPSCSVEAIVSYETYAESAADAYIRSVADVIRKHDVVDYITLTDSRFKVQFIGT